MLIENWTVGSLFFIMAACMFFTAGMAALCGFSYIFIYNTKSILFNIPRFKKKRRKSRFFGFIYARLKNGLDGDSLGEGLKKAVITNIIIAMRMFMALASVYLGIHFQNIILAVPVFLYFREFIVFILDSLKNTANKKILCETERMIRLFIREYNVIRNKKDALFAVSRQLKGRLAAAADTLYRSLASGDDPRRSYEMFAQNVPNHYVRLFSQYLLYNDMYGGEITGGLYKIVQDIMADHGEAERDNSENRASVFITILVNLIISGMFTYNIIFFPRNMDVFTSTSVGRILIFIAFVFCYISVRAVRAISRS